MRGYFARRRLGARGQVEVKRSPLKRKILTPAQEQIREETRRWKMDMKALGQKSRGRSGALGQYHAGEWIPSRWQLECLKILELREKAGEITNLESQPIIPFTIYNEAGERMDLKIEIDFTFHDKNINRNCRWDAKPPKVVHTKHGRRYPQKLHAEWMLRFKLLQFCQPDFDYRILTKDNCYLETDFNIMED